MNRELESIKNEFKDPIYEVVFAKMEEMDGIENVLEMFLQGNYVDRILSSGGKYEEGLILSASGDPNIDGDELMKIYKMDIPYWEKKVRCLIHGYKELCFGDIGGIARRSILWDLCAAVFVRQALDEELSIDSSLSGFDKFLAYVEGSDDWDAYEDFDVLPNGNEETIAGAIELLSLEQWDSWMSVVLASSLNALIKNSLYDAKVYGQGIDYDKIK